ncbi:MAG TPA: hypothetical protein VGM18_19455 [Candidatus Sulfotelmatobacter sp.]
MSTNSYFRKLTESQPPVVEPGQRKPPQRALVARPDEVVGASAPSIADRSAYGNRTMVVPATWAEAIRNPKIWAELRPLLVDED